MITFFLISGEPKKRKLPVQEYTDCAKVRKSVKRNEEVGVFGIAKNSKVLFGLLPPEIGFAENLICFLWKIKTHLAKLRKS